MKSWLLRSASGIVYVGIIVGSIFWGIYPFTLVAILFGVLAVFELEKICEGISENSLPTTLLDAAGIVAICFFWQVFPLIIWLFVYLGRIILELYLRNPRPIRCLAISLMSQIYIGLPLGLMTVIGFMQGLHFILAIFLMIWINDTGAFLVGSSIGKHRLFERISPKKSWEGSIGGGVVALASAFALGYFFPFMTYTEWAGLAIVTVIFGTWGDLTESLMKRQLGVKDSGSFFPGHGGMLDRFDSSLLAIPAAVIYLYCLVF